MTDPTIAGVGPAPLDEDALAWAVRVADPAFEDWDGFADWLAAAPAHSDRYNAATASLGAITAMVAATPIEPAVDTVTILPIIANDEAPRINRRAWFGGAIAAALTLTVGIGIWHNRAQPYAIETAAGEQRTLALADGSKVMLAAGTRVMLDRRDTRYAKLERGEALFVIRHDASDPFRVHAGDIDMVDVGTVFEVRVAADRTRVAVVEGAVKVDPKGAGMLLSQGQAVVASVGQLTREDAGDVGGWREGRLTYDGVPLREVAADLARHLGRPIEVAPAIAGRLFRGTILVAQIKDDPASLGSLLGVSIGIKAGRWRLEAER